MLTAFLRSYSNTPPIVRTHDALEIDPTPIRDIYFEQTDGTDLPCTNDSYGTIFPLERALRGLDRRWGSMWVETTLRPFFLPYSLLAQRFLSYISSEHLGVCSLSQTLFFFAVTETPRLSSPATRRRPHSRNRISQPLRPLFRIQKAKQMR
jgi:hypothetical protein